MTKKYTKETIESYDECGTLLKRTTKIIEEELGETSKTSGCGCDNCIPITANMKILPEGTTVKNARYIEIGGIRLIMQNGEVTGWYEPSLDRVLS